MQNQVPNAWKDINIEQSDSIEQCKTMLDKRKRKRTEGSRNSNTDTKKEEDIFQSKSSITSEDLEYKLNEINSENLIEKNVDPNLNKKDPIFCVENGLDLKNVIKMTMTKLPSRPDKIENIINGMTKNLTMIVNETSYRSTLKGSSSSTVTYTNNIRIVSKSYEDSYLREKLSENERSCIRGENCECMFIDKTQSFVGVEYVLPWEEKKGDVIGMCLPCTRATTQILFYDILHCGVVVNGIIQRFCNAHSTPGEYKLSAMLVCPPSGPIQNLPMPVVRHQRNFYSVYKESAVFYMKQVNVDF